MGSHLESLAMAGTVVAGGSEIDGGVAPVMLRRREDDDDVRDDEARMMVWSTSSGTARCDVEVRTEKLRAPARCGSRPCRRPTMGEKKRRTP